MVGPVSIGFYGDCGIFFFPCNGLWLPLVLAGEVVVEFWLVKWWWRWLWLVSIGFCGGCLFLYYYLRGFLFLDPFFFFFLVPKYPYSLRLSRGKTW